MPKKPGAKKPVRYRRIKADTVEEIRTLASSIMNWYCECNDEVCRCGGVGSSDYYAEEILKLLPKMKV